MRNSSSSFRHIRHLLRGRQGVTAQGNPMSVLKNIGETKCLN